MAHIATTGLNFSDHDEHRVEAGDPVPDELVEAWMIEQGLVVDDSVDWEALAALSDEERAALAESPPPRAPRSRSVGRSSGRGRASDQAAD